MYTGNKPYAGKPYGDRRHIGGQRGAAGAMPAWGEAAGGELTDAEILAVVCYERYGLGGGDLDVAASTSTTARPTRRTSPSWKTAASPPPASPSS